VQALEIVFEKRDRCDTPGERKLITHCSIDVVAVFDTEGLLNLTQSFLDKA
jgi:hypothetical protein